MIDGGWLILLSGLAAVLALGWLLLQIADWLSPPDRG